MKFSTASVLAASVSAVAGRYIEKGTGSSGEEHVVLHPEEKFLIETAPGKQQWVTEDEKWELRRVSGNISNQRPMSSLTTAF